MDPNKLVSAESLDGNAQGGAVGIEDGDIWDAVEDERFRGHGMEGGLALGGGGDFLSAHHGLLNLPDGWSLSVKLIIAL